MHVPTFLAEQRVAFEEAWHAPAFSAQRRARYLGVPGERVAKAVFLSGPRGYLLAVLPAPRRIDLEKLGHVLGGPVRTASEGELAAVFRDCEGGVVPPFGSHYGLPTLLDDAFDPEAELVFEANTHVLAVRLPCRTYERLERPRRLRFAAAGPGRTTRRGADQPV